MKEESSRREEVVTGFLSGEDDGFDVGVGLATCVGDEQAEVGQAIEAAGQAIGSGVQGGEGFGVEDGRRLLMIAGSVVAGAGVLHASQDVLGGLGSGELANHAAGDQAVGQGGGNQVEEFGIADEEEVEIGGSGGSEVEEEAEGFEDCGVGDEVGFVDDQEGAAAGSRGLAEVGGKSANQAGDSRSRRVTCA